ncbi:MAG: glycosyltransferase, partial [Actinomycetota bacterium]|nr:glycosyltransferase [Actinomycetota bacterium]
MPHVLLITYEFPPKGGPGVHRPLKTAKYLSRLGWNVTVLTVKDPLGGMMDESLLAELPDAVRVVRAWSLEPTRLVAAVRRLLRPGRGRTGGAAQGSGGGRGYTSLPRGAIRFVQAFFVPDEKVGWTPWAVRAASRVHAEKPVDVVLASGPPFSAYGVAWRVARRVGVPWAADLRDPIIGGYFFRPHTPIHAWLMRRYERKVVDSSHHVVTVTDGIADSLATRHPGVTAKLDVIANGFDPEDFVGLTHAATERFTVTYVGTFQGSIRPDALLAAIESDRAAERRFAGDVRVRFIGARDARTDAQVQARQLEDIVERTGYLSHADAVCEMVAADVLVLVLGPERESAGILTGKLPEYLAADRPVLAIVPDGVAADVVRRSGAGEVVHPEDTPGITAALERLHAQWRAGTLPAPDPAVVAEFDRAKLV